MIKKITENIWKISFISNLYFFDWDIKFVIDTGDRSDRSNISLFLERVVDPEKVEAVLFTHLHFDHCGNFDLFPNAVHYASRTELGTFASDPVGTVLRPDISEKIKTVKFEPLAADAFGLKVITTPGHTKGSVCFWLEKEKILFSGDTLFYNNNIGRTDLPTSVPAEMRNTLVRLLDYNFKTLCPGHDY